MGYAKKDRTYDAGPLGSYIQSKFSWWLSEFEKNEKKNW